MAVEPGFEGRGLGGRILAGLESAGSELGASRVVLNAREPAERFYERHGYAVVGSADTLFGSVVHRRMEKHFGCHP
jgi:GNAT superfamily N-acetyltransferase